MAHASQNPSPAPAALPIDVSAPGDTGAADAAAAPVAGGGDGIVVAGVVAADHPRRRQHGIALGEIEQQAAKGSALSTTYINDAFYMEYTDVDGNAVTSISTG